MVSLQWVEVWGLWSIPSLSLLPGPLWPEVVRPDIQISQIEMFDILTECKQMT